MHYFTKYIFVLLFIIIASSADAQDNMSDKDLKELLNGSWSTLMESEFGRLEGVSKYEEDGILTFSGTFDLLDEEVSIVGTASWNIQNGKLVTVILTSNLPTMLPVGAKSEDQILILNEKEFIYVDEDGIKTIETRF